MQLRVEPYNHTAVEAHSGRNLCREIARYDAIATFSNNVVNLGCSIRPNYIPTGYSDAEDVKFVRGSETIEMEGLCGGQARVMATAMLALTLGEDMPSLAFVGGKESDGVYRNEAAIYQKAYVGKVRLLRDIPGCIANRANSLPIDFGRELVISGSQSTATDIEHLIKTAQNRGLHELVAITNRFHARRLKQMADAAVKNSTAKGISIHCYIAEDIISSLSSERARPFYESVILTAYQQQIAHNRTRLEQIGIEMLNEGTYRSGEKKHVA